MGLTILASGIPHHVLFGNETIEVSPFIALDNQDNPDLILAVLYSKKDAEIFRVSSNSIIQAWRAMLILEQVVEINSTTLSSAWFTADATEFSSESYTEILKVFPGTARQLDEALKLIFASVPKPTELDQMVSIMQEFGLYPNPHELEVELEAGRITRTPLLNSFLEEVEEKRRSYQKLQEEIDAPVPPQHSLSVFFQNLNITDFTFGDCADWVYIETKTLDVTIKRESLSEWGTRPFILEHKIKQEKHGSLFGQPTHSPAKGITYTFNSAIWVKDHFDVNVTIESEGISHTSTFTVQELNQMIAAAPSPKVKPWDYLLRLF